jgi:regulator of sigma E protease
VIPRSPAEKAGLLPGDQFILIDGKEITKIKDIHEAIDQKGWGKELAITLLREGSKKEVTIILPPLKE